MLLTARLLLCAALVTGCSRGPSRAQPAAARPTVDPALSGDTARALAESFRRAGTEATVDGATVRAGTHVIVARATVGRVGPIEGQPENVVAAIEVALEVDGQRSDVFRVSSVAIDSDRNEAIQRAIREWNVGYGLAIVDALRASDPNAAATPRGDSAAQTSESRPAPLPLGPYLAYPGPTGIRGEAPEGWRRGTPEMHADFLRPVVAALDELIPQQRRPGYHTLKITLHVRNGVGGEGECVVDGAQQARLCEIARQYAWPQGPEEYLFKQFYVLAPGGRN